MTEAEYRAAVRALGLRPSANVPTVFLDAKGTAYNVPNPADLPPDARARIIDLLKMALGVG